MTEENTNQESERLENQPLDFTVVKPAKKIRPQRPELPAEVNNVVSKELRDHIKNM